MPKSSFFSASLLLEHIFKILAFFRFGLQIMVLLVIWTVLFRLTVTQVVKQRLLWVQNLIMGVYQVMGVKFLDTMGLKIEKMQ